MLCEWAEPHLETDAGILRAIVRRRHSCRAFLDRDVDLRVVETIVDTARYTASWCNTQPWHVLITSRDATRQFCDGLWTAAHERSTEPDLAFPTRYRACYEARRRASAMQLYESLGISRGSRQLRARHFEENYRLFGAPHVAIVSTDRDLGTYGAIDCGGFVHNFMLAAEAVGVATLAQASIVAFAPYVRQYFSIPFDRLLVCGIAFGYEDLSHAANRCRTHRVPLSEVMTWVDASCEGQLPATSGTEDAARS